MNIYYKIFSKIIIKIRYSQKNEPMQAKQIFFIIKCSYVLETIQFGQNSIFNLGKGDKLKKNFVFKIVSLML